MKNENNLFNMALSSHVESQHNQTQPQKEPEYCHWSVNDHSHMPTPTIRTIMLEELREHHYTTQRQ